MTDAVVVERLAARHDRSAFSCGKPTLDHYFRERAGQDQRRLVANCFVAVLPDRRIAGFYTFSAADIPSSALAVDDQRRLPRYPALPAALIGRLALDKRFQGRGIGSAMIVDAGRRAMQSDPAVFALLVDAKDQGAADFYRHHDFRPFPDHPLRLFLPLTTLVKAGRP